MDQIFNRITPDIFKQRPINKVLKLNDITYIKYKTQTNHKNVNMLFTMNILVVVLQGEKILYHEDKSIHIRAGEAFFAAKGAYVGAQLLDTSEYRALVFFIDDEFIILRVNEGNGKLTGHAGSFTFGMVGEKSFDAKMIGQPRGLS